MSCRNYDTLTSSTTKPMDDSVNGDDVVEKLQHLDIVDDEQISDPAAFLSFESHQNAIDALESVGYRNPNACFSFSPVELVDAVSELLKDESICILNMTPTIPETAAAAYQSLTVAGFNASVSCRKDKNCAFLIQKTVQNTPSFLFGSHWASVQALGRTTTTLRIEKCTPIAYVFFRERQICLPSSTRNADVDLAARIVAFEITMDTRFFSCSLCGTPFITHDGGDMEIAPLAKTSDGRMLLRDCALKLLDD